MADEDKELKDFMKSIGPKRVKTKDVEIEAHNIRDAQKVMERRRASWPTLGSIPITVVEPKDGCPCQDIE